MLRTSFRVNSHSIVYLIVKELLVRSRHQKYYKNDARLPLISFEDEHILKIIRSFNINKDHVHDDISIRMINICDSALVKPLSMNCIQSGSFPDIWKKSNHIPVNINGEKHYINNYRTVSLLPICGKTFERRIFNQVFNFLEENKLSKSTSVVSDIYGDSDNNSLLEVRGSYLDISIAYDRFWQKWKISLVTSY